MAYRNISLATLVSDAEALGIPLLGQPIEKNYANGFIKPGPMRAYDFKSKDPNNRTNIPYYRKTIKLPNRDSTISEQRVSPKQSPNLAINTSVSQLEPDMPALERNFRSPHLAKSPSLYRGLPSLRSCPQSPEPLQINARSS